MRFFYFLAAALFAVASYQVFTGDISQPIVSAALDAGLGWFTLSAIVEE